LAVKTLNGELAGKGFIPINLTLELDGISGMLLFQRITPTEEILPYSYTNKINLLIEAMDHTIQNNEWTTSIKTIATPKKADLSKNVGGNNEFSLLKSPKVV
jgi:hypothetical protein